MFLTSNQDIFSFRKNGKRVSELNEQLNSLNLYMMPIKKRWAESVMAYNLVSRDAYRHRFTKYKSQMGVKNGSNGETSYTLEDVEGKYIVSEFTNEIVDRFFDEITSRNFTCNVKSIAYQELVPIWQFLMNQNIDNVSFKDALHSAIKDALVKGTGFIRPRLYDLEKEVDQLQFEKIKGSLTTTLKKVKSGKFGLTIEYVDVDNVFLDYTTNNPKELIISTPYTEMELIDMFPSIKNKLKMKYLNQNSVTGSESTADILPTNLDFYKVGEKLSAAYHNYDKFEDKKQSDGMHLMGVPELPDKFNGKWDSIFFGDKFKEIYKNGTYRLNEYYNWAANRYCVWIGDYILYDGEMFESLKENPLIPIYFKDPAGTSIFGESVHDTIKHIEEKHSKDETDYQELKKRASVTFLQVREDAIPEDPISVDKLTVLKSNSIDGNPGWTPIPLQYPTLQMQSNDDTISRNKMYFKYPDTRNITAQMGKDGVKEMIFSPDIQIQAVLNGITKSLTKFAYVLITAKVFEANYLSFKSENNGFALPFKKQSALIVRVDSATLKQEEKKVKQFLVDQYGVQLEQAKNVIMKSEEFTAKMQQIAQQEQAKFQDVIDQARKQGKEIDQQTQSMVDEKMRESIKNKIETEAYNIAKQQVPEPQDNNVYLSLSSFNNILELEKNIEFDFTKSKQEIIMAMNNFLSIGSKIPVATLAIDYEAFLREFCLANNLNPDVIAKEVQPATAMQAQMSSRVTTYLDVQTNPILGSAVVQRAFDFSEEEMLMKERNPGLESVKAYKQLDAEFSKDIQTNRITLSGQSAMAKEGLKAELKNQQNMPGMGTPNEVLQNDQPQG